MVSTATPRGFGGLAVPPKTTPARGVARRLHPGEVEARPPKCWKEHAGQLVMTVKTGTRSGPRGR